MYDVAIIGGGPAGLSAALLLGRAMRQVIVIDAGQPRNRSSRALHGFLGHDPIPPEQLLELGRAEIALYGVEFLRDKVVDAAPVGQEAGTLSTRFRLNTALGHTFVARKLLVAAGVADDLPDIPGLRECYGLSVHHCPYCDGWEHRGRPLFAIGESLPGAIGLARSLRSWSGQVTLLTRGPTLAAADREHLHRSGIAYCESDVRQIVHEHGQMRAVELTDGRRLCGEALFFQAAQNQRSRLLESLGCYIDRRQHAVGTERQRTDVPGVFVAGDVDGDVQFAIVAAAEGATAAVSIHGELADEDRSAADELAAGQMKGAAAAPTGQ